jgi:phage tail-like protein
MRPQGPTSFYLSGPASQWLTAKATSISLGDLAGLTLSTRADGPLGLNSEDGSLGGSILPRGIASDEAGILLILGKQDPGVRRFDPESCEFVPLKGVGDECGSEIGQFKEPSNIAVIADNLYVADPGNSRVQVFALGTRSVKHVWGPRNDNGRRVQAGSRRAWEPIDVAAQGDYAYILDRRHSRVYIHRPGTDQLLPFIHATTQKSWSRLAVDNEGRVHLLRQSLNGPRVDIYDQRGRFLSAAQDAGEIHDRFHPPTVQLRRMDENGPWVFSLPEALQLLCGKCDEERRRLAFKQQCDPPAPVSPVDVVAPSKFIFDREGRRCTGKQNQQSIDGVFEKEGQWYSKPLDSQTYRCQWHRIELDLYQLPPGTRVEVRTYTADDAKLTPEDLEERFNKFGKLAYRIAGQIEKPGERKSRGESRANGLHEFLIQSREGQYLWIKLIFLSDGYGTPALRSVRIHYPRESYMQYLPAVFSSDDESRWFLERFLSIFQTEWDALEDRIADVPALFDPKAVPAGAALDFLASWFALPLEGEWTDKQKRTLLEAVSGIYFGRWKATGEDSQCLTEIDPANATRRGTREGLRRYLQVYLQNITSLTAEEQGGFPRIDEGFRERQRLMLTLSDTARLSHGAPLWSPSATGRMHFDSFAREGEARMISIGDPEHEIFQEFAHRFRVFVPSSWISTAKDEEMVHRALREEKPAHTSYDLCLVEPRFRVGLQSTVGVDTIVGGWPRAHLACTHSPDVPPSRPPRHRLGFDTVLAAQPGPQPTLQVSRTRAGIDTVLN